MVVKRIVDATKAQRWAVLVRFRSVVVHDIHHDFEAAGMQRLDHIAELADRCRTRTTGPVAGLRCKKCNARITPVVGQAQQLQARLIRTVMKRQHAHGRNTKVLQIVQHSRTCHATIASPQRLRNIGKPLCHPFYMYFVQHRVCVRHPRRGIALPVIRLVNHTGLEGDVRVVQQIRLIDVDHVVATEGGLRLVMADYQPRIGIQQNLVRIEALPVLRRVWSSDAIAIH